MYYGTPPIVTDGLVLNLDAANTLSYQSGSTTWNDLSGNRNNGTLTNGPTFNSNNGGGITFDGIDDYVTLGTRTIIQTDFAVSMWYKLNSNSVKEHFLFSCNYNATPSALITANDAGNGNHILTFYYVSSGGGVSSNLITSTNLNVSNIYNITVVRLNGVNTPYVNGIEQTSKIFTNSAVLGSSRYELGYATLRAKTTAYMQGNIYTTQLYNRALSQQEVLQNYNATKSRFNLT